MDFLWIYVNYVSVHISFSLYISGNSHYVLDVWAFHEQNALQNTMVVANQKSKYAHFKKNLFEALKREI